MKKTDLYLKPGTYIKSSSAIGDIQGISLENFVVSVLNNPTCCTKPSFIKDGMLMTDTFLSTSLQTVKDQSTNSSPLKLSTTLVRVESNLQVGERLLIEADSTVTTQTSSVIQSSTTNASLVIAPNGTGALIANIPDGTATGGNARGQYSVDLQRFRDTNTKVAAGEKSVISGGQSNSIDVNSSLSVIGGGLSNRIESGAYGVIVGGNSNFINGGFGFNHIIVGGTGNTTGGGNGGTFIGGGSSNNIALSAGSAVITGGASNSISGNSSYSTVSGGQSNTASTNTHATVVGGQSNTASGQYSVAGGFTNTSSSTSTTISGGQSNIASSTFATVLGGRSNTAGGVDSIAGGSFSQATNTQAVSLGGSNVASGIGSVTIGRSCNANVESGVSIGYQNLASGKYSHAFGLGCTSYLQGMQSFSSVGGFSNNGQAQLSNLVPTRSAALTTASTTVLSLDGTGVTALLIPSGNNRAWNVQVNWVAVVTTITGTATGISVGDVVTSVDLLGFKKVGGVSSTSAHTSAATKLMVTTPAAYAACAINYTAGASQEMALTFTGPTFVGGGSVTMQIVARVEIAENAW
jgi:hypothetical protein